MKHIWEYIKNLFRKPLGNSTIFRSTSLPDQTGESGKFLTTDGSTASWGTPAGGGDVSKVGTPVDSQVGVWTGDGTIEGDTALTFDTTTDTLSVTTSGVVTTGTIEVGHASDTTVSRSGAGQLAVEGVAVPTISSSDTLTNKTIDVDNNTVSNIETDNIAAATLVTEADAILSNDNDTTLPTSAAVRDMQDDTHNDYYMFGFLDQSETTLAFNDSTYTFTLGDAGAGWSYYRQGIKYTISGDKTTTLAGSPPTAGLYFIYIDATDGTLSNSTTPWTLADTKVPVALVLWNNSNTPKYIIAEERHSARWPRWVHKYMHSTMGTRFESGGVLADYTVQGSSDAENTFSITETKIWDEDIQNTCAALADPDGATDAYHIQFRTAADTWSWELSEVPFRYTAAGYIQYDSSGTMTQGQASKYYNSYLIATNAVSGNAARFTIIPGQAEHASLSDALAEEFSDLTLTGLPIAEAVALWQLTWETSNSYAMKGKARLAIAPRKITTSLTTASSLPALGTMATQNANDVDITGGSIAGATLTTATIDADNNTISNIALGAEATGALADLSDVTEATVADGELLKYTTDHWENQTLAEAGVQGVLSEGAFVDGDKTKLDGIEASADVTDTANVTSAGALMDSELTDIAAIKATADAVASDLNTGTDTAKFVTPDALAGSNLGIRYVQVMVTDVATETSTGDGKAYFHIPAGMTGMNLVEVHAEVVTAPTGSTETYMIHNVTQAADMLSTAITIDATETGSDTAATAAVIDTANDDITTNDVIRIDIDGVGSSTAAKGLFVTMGFQLP